MFSEDKGNKIQCTSNATPRKIGVIFRHADGHLARLYLILRDQHFHGVSEKLSGRHVRPSIHSDETNGPERKQRFLTLLHRSVITAKACSANANFLFRPTTTFGLPLPGQERAALPENVLKAESHFLSNGPSSRGQEQNGMTR